MEVDDVVVGGGSRVSVVVEAEEHYDVDEISCVCCLL